MPETLLSETKKPGYFREWMDSVFSRDIQRLFAFRDPDKFNALFEFVMKQSGGLLEITRTAGALGISRPTEVDAIECKWDPAEFDATALRLFRIYYPRGGNYVLSPVSGPGYPKRACGLVVFASSPEGWKE